MLELSCIGCGLLTCIGVINTTLPRWKKRSRNAGERIQACGNFLDLFGKLSGLLLVLDVALFYCRAISLSVRNVTLERRLLFGICSQLLTQIWILIIKVLSSIKDLVSLRKYKAKRIGIV